MAEQVNLGELLKPLPSLEKASKGENKAEQVLLGELSDRLPAPKEPEPRSYLEWTGSQLMGRLLFFICAIALVFLIAWGWTRPDLQDALKLVAATQEGLGGTVTTKALTDVLGQLQKNHTDQFQNLFQLVVMSALVPLFTLLAGYVFGRREEAPDGEGNSAQTP